MLNMVARGVDGVLMRVTGCLGGAMEEYQEQFGGFL
jgi:hypothetical protein